MQLLEYRLTGGLFKFRTICSLAYLYRVCLVVPLCSYYFGANDARKNILQNKEAKNTYLHIHLNQPMSGAVFVHSFLYWKFIVNGNISIQWLSEKSYFLELYVNFLHISVVLSHLSCLILYNTITLTHMLKHTSSMICTFRNSSKTN